MAAHLHREPRTWTPNRSTAPWREVAGTVAPYLAAAVLLIAVGIVDWRLSVSLGVVATTAGASWGVVWLVRRSRERAEADRFIRGHRYLHPASDLVARRAAELSGPKMRRLLASSLRDAARKSQRLALLSASPLNTAAVRENSALIERLADRLDDLRQPVSARGVLLTRDLLTHGGSPLYDHAKQQELESALLSVMAALEKGR